MATKMTKPAITTHPCHAQGGPQPQPYFFAGNQMCFLSFFIVAWLAANVPAQRPSIPGVVQLDGCSNFTRDAPIATAKLSAVVRRSAGFGSSFITSAG